MRHGRCAFPSLQCPDTGHSGKNLLTPLPTPRTRTSATPWLPIRSCRPTYHQLHIRLDLTPTRIAQGQVPPHLFDLFLKMLWHNMSSHQSAELVICQFKSRCRDRTLADLPASLIPASLLFLLGFYQTRRIWASRSYCEPRTHYLLFAVSFGFSALTGYIHLLKRRLREKQLGSGDGTD